VEAEDAVGRKGEARAALPPRLPAELRPGARAPLPGGAKIPVYLRLLPGDAGILELVYVPPGDFVMGADKVADNSSNASEWPRHVHPMDHGYWIGRTDVTWHQYLAFCAATGRAPPRRPDWAKDDHPVVFVSWDDARASCSWAGFALPTEPEWEKAARGTDGRRFPWGDERWDGTQANLGDASVLAYPQVVAPFLERGWVDREVNDGYAFTAPVGSFKAGASPFGALDMAGNAWQWCEDAHDANVYARYAAGDFASPRDGPARVVRGGGWFNPAADGRTAHRGAGARDTLGEGIGFRVVLR
jgi:formylglycine-generating enzyme required for sulfatase activity